MLFKKRKKRIQIELQDGRLNIVGLGRWTTYWKEPYHLLLTIPWLGFFGIIFLGYSIFNLFFASLYFSCGGGIVGADPESFYDTFHLSVQTMASIGYGAMYPNTVCTHTVVFIEAISAIISYAVVTGLIFARFSRPQARVSYSDLAVVGPHEGVPTLQFRVANMRQNQLLNAHLRLYLMMDDVSREGQRLRQVYDLKLLRDRMPAFSLNWTARHAIDADSPLYGLTREQLTRCKAMFLTSVTGVDDTVAQSVFASHIYAAQDIHWDHYFAEIYHYTADGHRYIEYSHFNTVVPVE